MTTHTQTKNWKKKKIINKNKPTMVSARVVAKWGFLRHFVYGYGKSRQEFFVNMNFSRSAL